MTILNATQSLTVPKMGTIGSRSQVTANTRNTNAATAEKRRYHEPAI
jgi:hypothetical protein